METMTLDHWLVRRDLRNNSLSELPSGIFDSLSALEILNLESNKLSKLPDGVFDSLTALTFLCVLQFG